MQNRALLTHALDDLSAVHAMIERHQPQACYKIVIHPRSALAVGDKIFDFPLVVAIMFDPDEWLHMPTSWASSSPENQHIKVVQAVSFPAAAIIHCGDLDEQSMTF